MAGAELLNELTTVALGQVELSDAALRASTKAQTATPPTTRKC
jgi:hypothetical protein